MIEGGDVTQKKISASVSVIKNILIQEPNPSKYFEIMQNL